MKPRPSKVPPAPLYKKDDPATAAANTGAPRPDKNGTGSEPARSVPGGMYMSPTGTAGGGKSRAVTDPVGLPVEERVVLADHVTNSGTVVSLTRIDYSDVMRAYRVCRQSHIGTAANVHPLLKLLTVNDMLLAVLTFALFLHAIAHGAGLDGADLLARLFTSHEPLAALFSTHFRLVLMVACPLLLIVRLVLALRCIYVEEVLAIRGIGIQFTTYGVFNQVKSKEFIDLRLVRSIVIHDSFWRYQPIFTLTSSIENRATRVVYFENVLPRLEVLRPVLCGIRHILFEELEEGPSLSDMETEQRLANADDQDSGAVSRDTDSTFDDSFTGMNTSDEYEIHAEL